MKPLQFIGWALFVALLLLPITRSRRDDSVALRAVALQWEATAHQWETNSNKFERECLRVQQIAANAIGECAKAQALASQYQQALHECQAALGTTNRSAFPLNVPPPAWPGGAPR